MKRFLPIVFLFLFGCLCSSAQTSIQIDPEVAAQHLLPSPTPIYPAIARAAQVTGTVVVLVVIDENGRVAEGWVVSGPPILQFAALQSVRQFTFSPFQQDGKPVEAITAIGILFQMNGESASLPGSVYVLTKLKMDEGMKRRGEVLASYATCNRQLQQRTATSQAIQLCQDAVQKAEKLPSGTFELRAALVDYANALIQGGKPGAAIDPGNRAIAVANANHDDFAGASAAYATTGEALALTGNLQEAEKDFSAAEQYTRKAIGATPAHSPQKEQLSQTLKSMLEYHAKILEKMGKQDEAQKKLKEAAKL